MRSFNYPLSTHLTQLHFSCYLFTVAEILSRQHDCQKHVTNFMGTEQWHFELSPKQIRAPLLSIDPDITKQHFKICCMTVHKKLCIPHAHGSCPVRDTTRPKLEVDQCKLIQEVVTLYV